MYPDEKLTFLNMRSCSNFYKLLKDLNNHSFCVALGSGASATVGLPTWRHFLKRICYSYFEHWATEIATKVADEYHPPKKTSIAFTNDYDRYLCNKQYRDREIKIDEILLNGRKLSDREIKNFQMKMSEINQVTSQLQGKFMKLLMSGDLTVIAQMIKNQIRENDWNYLIRKSLYSSYEDNPYVLRLSELYNELTKLIKTNNIDTIINYNYDDTFFHALRRAGIRFNSCYGPLKKNTSKTIFYPHGYIPMDGGVLTNIVLCESDYHD